MFGSLYLLRNFNNYFNRRIIKKDNLQDYLDIVGEKGFHLLEETNFNPNDGINTSHIVGDSAHPFEPQEGEDDWNPDYVLYVEEGIIKSRWFVLEFTRKLVGQYEMTLKRDSIADKYDLVVNAETYIEKGHLQEEDVQIVNSEGLSVNQIKDGEYFLKDKTKCPWVIAYVPQDRKGEDTIETSIKGYDIDALLESERGIPNLTDDAEAIKAFLPNGNFRTSAKLREYNPYTWSIRCGFGWHYIVGIPSWISCFMDVIGEQIQYGAYGGFGGRKSMWWGHHIPERIIFIETICMPVIGKFLDTYQSDIANAVGRHFSLTTDYYDSKTNPRPNIKNGKIVKYNNKYYRMSVSSGGSTKTDTSKWYESSFLDLLKASSDAIGKDVQIAGQREAPEIFNTQYREYSYTLTEIALGKRAKGFIRNNTMHTLDAPYDIIAMPLGNINVKKNGSLQFTTNFNIPISFARQMVVKMTNQVCYDVQILPFCPCEGLINKDGKTGLLINENGEIDLTNYIDGTDYGIIKDANNNPISIFIFANYSHRTDDIVELGLDAYGTESTLVSSITSEWLDNRKLCNECTIERLVSPNYNGLFEFNLSKMVPLDKPYLESFNFNVDFRPYNPYIHINPNFGFLYGKDYNDQRGLICGGNFGITTMSDKWQEYQLNNKNFQSMFDRGIQSLEIQRALAREYENFRVGSANVGAILGGLGAGAGAGLAIAKKGLNPATAIGGGLGIAGAIIGGQMAKKGANLSRDIAEETYKENRSFKIDMFNMQMGNIQALPQSIATTSSLTYNFKWFPVLEHYRCTPEEESYVNEKLKYNGMTVGRIDKISNFVDTEEERFVKGQIIRLSDLGEDSHLASDIYNEINGGIFFNPYIPENNGDNKPIFNVKYSRGESYGKK